MLHEDAPPSGDFGQFLYGEITAQGVADVLRDADVTAAGRLLGGSGACSRCDEFWMAAP